MIHVVTHQASVQEVRRELGLGADDRLDLTKIAVELFAPTSSLTDPPWPDFLASDIADWPSRSREVVAPQAPGAAPACSDVALVMAFTGTVPPLPALPDLFLLRHQTSGHLAGEFRCAAVRLDVSDVAVDLGNAIAERWHMTSAALGWIPFEDLFEYRTLLQEHGVDCNETYRHFAEGVYPIDLDDYALETLSTDGADVLMKVTPDDLARACLVFLAPNSAVG